MTAKEAISAVKNIDKGVAHRQVDADMPLLEVLPRLLDSPEREIEVRQSGISMGIIDRDSLLEGLGKLITGRDDCSTITIACNAEDYSASHIARAVEDSDAHLVDLLTSPGEEGKLIVTLRVRHRDPTAAVRSLERYNYEVIEAHGSGCDSDELNLMTERLMSLQTLMNV